MTSKEFNEKYKDFLEEGHYGLAVDIPEVTEFLDDIFEDLTCIPGFQYSQIKSKFGMPRFYSNLQSPRLSALIEHKLLLLFQKDELKKEGYT